MKICILYNSRTGVTKKMAEEMFRYLSEYGASPTLSSIQQYDPEKLRNADRILLGTWTNGLFLFAQHPDRKWKKWIKTIPVAEPEKIGLFTTYKLLSGTQFKKMSQALQFTPELQLKSRNGKLSPENKNLLTAWLEK